MNHSIRSVTHTLSTFAVEIFGRLAAEDSSFTDQLAERVVRGSVGESLARTGICKERLLPIVWITTQVAKSRTGCLNRNSNVGSAGGQKEQRGGV